MPDRQTENLSGKTLIASYMHAPELGKVEICWDAAIEIGGSGEIVNVTQKRDPEYDAILADQSRTLVKLDRDKYLLPGFVDLHIHAPQWPQLGKALDVPLEIWLQQHTFPLEARYSDAEFAKRVYADLVHSLLANGTTTAVYFATIHQQATCVLAETCLDKGQRALVGRVVMDDPAQCPEYYRDETTEKALDETREFVEFVRSMPDNQNSFVQPVVTPRFIPSCTDQALEGLGKIAEECACHVQTHCSESDWEHEYVLNRTGKTDTQALKDFGLLKEHTVLAHGNFIPDGDMDTIMEAGAGVAHCPYSNIYFSNAVFPLRHALEKSMKVGLGTDISGGPSPSILETCRHVISSSRMLEEGVSPYLPRDERRLENNRVDFREAFYLATLGGAEVLGLPVGLFEAGRKFDAILVDPAAQSAPILIDEELDTDEDKLQKIISLAGRANISHVWTNGNLVIEN